MYVVNDNVNYMNHFKVLYVYIRLGNFLLTFMCCHNDLKEWIEVLNYRWFIYYIMFSFNCKKDYIPEKNYQWWIKNLKTK